MGMSVEMIVIQLLSMERSELEQALAKLSTDFPEWMAEFKDLMEQFK